MKALRSFYLTSSSGSHPRLSYSMEKNKSEDSPNSQIAMRHVCTSVQLIQRWWTSESHTEDCFDSEARDTSCFASIHNNFHPCHGSTVDLETSSTLEFAFWWLLPQMNWLWLIYLDSCALQRRYHVVANFEKGGMSTNHHKRNPPQPPQQQRIILIQDIKDFQ